MQFPSPVVGLYSVPAASCSLVASCGFNVVHSYDFESDRPPDVQAWVGIARPYLDNAAKFGLKVLLGVPRNWLRGKLDEPVRSAVRALRDHPAILAWYEDEIAQGGDVAAVEFWVQIVAAEDPTHGVILEEGKDLPQLRPWGRVRMFTYYPVTAPARDSGRLKTIRQRFPVDTLGKPFWPALQAYGRDLIQGYSKRDLVAPTRSEMQFTLCSALLAGARGVFIYTFLHSTRYDLDLVAQKKWPYIDARPLPEVSPSLWASAVSCAAEARRVLSALDKAGPCKDVVVTSPEPIDSGAWTTPEGTWVILANPAYQPQNVVLRFPVRMQRASQVAGSNLEPLRLQEPGRLEVEVRGPGGACILLQPAAAGS